VFAAQAANIVIVNNDSPGEGLNDPSPPILPASGNSGTTLGQQRLIVLQAAARQWGALLKSNVTIRVTANFDDIQCDASYVLYADTGPTYFVLPGSVPPPGIMAKTWYPQALYEAKNGDYFSKPSTISAQFNKAVDKGCFPGTSHYWYGIDTSVKAPAGMPDLLRIAMHEFGHGLGFINYVCKDPAGCGSVPFGGFRLDASNNELPDIFSRFVVDWDYGYWDSIDQPTRAVSLRNDPNVAWGGLVTIGALALPQYSLNTGYLDGASGRFMRINALAGTGVADTQHWTPDADKGFLMGGTGQIPTNDPVDITYNVFQDIGWSVNPRDTLFNNNFDIH